MRKDDIRLMRRAIRNRWPLTEARRREIVEKLMAVLAGAEDERTAVAAAKALISADQVNMQQAALDLKDRQAGDPLKLDLTTGGKPLEPAFTLTPADLAAAAAIVGVARGDLLADRRSEPIHTTNGKAH